MKNTCLMFIRLLILVLTAIVGQASWAGQWVLDRYEVEQNFTDYNWWKSSPAPPIVYYLKNQNINLAVDLKPVKEVIQSPGGPYRIFSYFDISSHSDDDTVHPPRQTARLTITPIYKWVGSENEQPTSSFYVQERGYCSLAEINNSSAYSILYPYSGQLTTSVNATNGFSEGLPNKYNQGHESWREESNNGWHVSRINVDANSTEMPGQTRTLKGTADISSFIVHNQVRYHGALTLEYEAQVCNFALDAAYYNGTDGAVYEVNKPQIKQVRTWAHSARTPMGGNDPNKWYWNGRADYQVNMSPNLSQTMGNKTYNWQVTGGAQGKVVHDPNHYTDESVKQTSTPTKNFNHQLTPFADNSVPPFSEVDPWPDATFKNTRVKVEVQSEDNNQPILAGNVLTRWRRYASTKYSGKVTYYAFDLDTGEKIQLDAAQINSETASLMGSNPNDPEEVQQIDGYVDQITSVKKETFEMGCTLVSAALEAQMMVFSWYVPDEFDLLLPGLSKGIKAQKTLELVGRVVAGVNKLPNRTLASAKKILPGRNIIVKADVEIVNLGKIGEKNHDEVYTDLDKVGEVKKDTCLFGDACFVKGTLILMADGTFKPIEKIAVGNLVASKSEVAGKKGVKNVSQIFKRLAPRTLKVTFSNGEVIETTQEHPFYKDSGEFIPISSFEIGEHALTKDGTPLKITDIKRNDFSQEVYNFTVDDFHTYFVGKSALWVHNANYEYKPRDPVPYPKHPTSRPLGMDVPPGEYVYVQDLNGVIHIAENGPHMHPKVLGGAQSVRGAGTITIGADGKVIGLDNYSGTFEPFVESMAGVMQAVQGLGFEITQGAVRGWDKIKDAPWRP